MRIDEVFEIAAGSVVGRTHAIAGKPNQDAFAFQMGQGAFVGVVCDGCGSSARSEVGTAMGSKMICAALCAEIERGASLEDEATFERVRRATLDSLLPVVHAMGASHSQIANDFFLFTVLGVAISPLQTVVFGIGDGLFLVGDEMVKLGPFPGNAPPYLAYGLFREGPSFLRHRVLATSEVDSILIATDGALDYDAAVGKKRPGGVASRGEVVAPLGAFCLEDRYFHNPDAIRRALSLVNREVMRPEWSERRLHKEPGLLEDDTTLLVARRKKPAA